VSDCLTKAFVAGRAGGSWYAACLILLVGPWLSVRRGVLRCGVRVHELKDMHEDINLWPGKAAV
jgi:hypothetical protein